MVLKLTLVTRLEDLARLARGSRFTMSSDRIAEAAGGVCARHGPLQRNDATRGARCHETGGTKKGRLTYCRGQAARRWETLPTAW